MKYPIEEKFSSDEELLRLIKKVEREKAYNDVKINLAEVEKYCFKKYCMKEYLNTCEPAYCSFQITNSCDYIKVIHFLEKNFKIDIVKGDIIVE
ncbi:hypothetical protein ISS22_11355 [candidate division KSB1 bacterium]|nr:hypothetical protein [candidate division KSB1 bacterium]